MSGLQQSIVLPFKMTKVPFGWDYRAPAFLSFAQFALESEAMRTCYRDETGIDLNQFVGRSPLDSMIDEATGYAEETLSAFLDWLVVTHWGEME